MIAAAVVGVLLLVLIRAFGCHKDAVAGANGPPPSGKSAELPPTRTSAVGGRPPAGGGGVYADDANAVKLRDSRGMDARALPYHGGGTPWPAGGGRRSHLDNAAEEAHWPELASGERVDKVRRWQRRAHTLVPHCAV